MRTFTIELLTAGLGLLSAQPGAAQQQTGMCGMPMQPPQTQPPEPAPPSPQPPAQ